MPDKEDVKSKIKYTIVEINLVIGGIQMLTVDQLKRLDRDIFDVELVTLVQSNKKDLYNEVPSDVKIHKLNFRGLLDVPSWWAAYKVLKKIKPDVVKSSVFFSNTVTRILKPLVGYQVIAAEHNTNEGKNKVQKILNKILSKLSYTTVVDSKMVAECLSERENIPISRYTVIYNGVDIKAVEASIEEYGPNRSNLREEYNVNESDKLFFTVGRIVKQKNHARMVAAFAELLKTRSDVKLIIIGDGPCKADLEKQINNLRVDGNVTLLSARRDLHKFYAMSDFTLLSSDHEGFCIAAMEGLAFGAPLISTRVAGVSEYLKDGENGFFAEKTPEGLAEAMNRVLQLPEVELEKMKKSAERTAEDYSVEVYIDRISKLIIDCAK